MDLEGSQMVSPLAGGVSDRNLPNWFGRSGADRRRRRRTVVRVLAIAAAAIPLSLSVDQVMAVGIEPQATSGAFPA